MGARHSKRSVDITTTPKKGGDGAEGGDAKLEAVGEPDVKAATNGSLPSDIEFADKDESSKEEEEEAVEVKENGMPEEVHASEEAPEATTPKPEDPAEAKKKKEKKKKWSFRSISFSRKDKSKPSKEGGSEKNGDVAELAEESADSDKTPSPEGVAPVEGEAPAPLTNDDHAVPEPQAAPASAPTQQEVPVKADVAPFTVQPVQEEATVAGKEEQLIGIKEESSLQTAQSPAKEEPKTEEQPAEADTQPEALEKVMEPSIEVPPPLPTSNPPSPVTVFAESTKAEAALTSGQLPLEETKEEGSVAQIPLPMEQEVEVETAKPDPSPSMEELPPAPPSPVPEVEPPAEPAQEEPVTPPPTPAPSVEATASPVAEEVVVASAGSLPDVSTESLPSLPEAVSESLAPLSLPPVDVAPEPIADTPSPSLVEDTPPLAPLTNGNVNGHSSPSPVREAVLPLPTKQINADKECEIITEAGDVPVDSTVATSEE